MIICTILPLNLLFVNKYLWKNDNKTGISLGIFHRLFAKKTYNTAAYH